jgi:two-component system, NtrC family, sensor histidine kinase HydH
MQLSSKGKKWLKAGIAALMIAAILYLHYFTLPTRAYYHAVYRTLFYVPLVLGAFWFGWKGALFVCFSVLVLISPYVVARWHGFSLQEFETMLEGVLFIVVAAILAFLVEKEKRQRAARLEVERLAAIGKAASEVAHEMKTPLMAIGGFTSQVSRAFKSDEPNGKKLEIVLKETARLESLVRDMLEFGRPLQIEPTQENLNQLLVQAVEMSLPMAKEAGVEVEALPDPSLPVASMDASKIKQVILNLLSNAIQVSPSGEKIRARTSVDRDAVILEIEDTGTGIKEEDRERIFEPFFTTKKGGTGLGLAIVKKVLEAQGGKIVFHPNQGRGVTFRVSLPLKTSHQ